MEMGKIISARMRMFSKQQARWVLCFLFVWCSALSAAPSFAGKIQKLIGQPAYKKTQFSIHVYDLESGKTVFSHRKNQPLVPASNMKLVTTAASLDLLGEDFRYETVFSLHKGNLVILASGDPLTGDPVLAKQKGESILEIFHRLVDQLKKKNIQVIPGDLVVDATFFDDQRFHPSWSIAQADKWYTAQIDALNFNNNCLDITFVPATSTGSLVSYLTSPKTSYVNITNKGKTIKSGKSAIGAARFQDTNNITLRGRCRYEQTIYVTVDRPSAYFAHVLAEYLLANNITIKGKLVIPEVPTKNSDGQLSDDFQILYTHRTPIQDVLKRCNQNSLNMAAECLFKTSGAIFADNHKLDQPGAWPTGQLASQAFLEKCKVSPDQFAINDGSGLSAANRLSASSLSSVLIYMYKNPAFETYRNSLATPEAGTLKKSRRFSELKYQGRLFAKTGYISRAWALSGYCRDKYDHWLAFSIIANKGSQSPRNLIDQMVKALMN